MSEKITAYDNTVLGEGGYSDAGEIDLNELLTGEDTNKALVDMILGVAGPAGSVKYLTNLIRSKGGIEIIKRMIPKSKDVIKFIEGMNKKSIKNLSKQKGIDAQGDGVISKFIKENQVALTNEGRNALNKALAEGFKGQKAIDKAFAQRPDGSYFIKGNINTDKYTLDMQGNLRKLEEILTQGTKGYSTKVTENVLPIIPKYTKGVPAVIPKGSPKQPFSNFDFDDIAKGLTTFTSLLAAITASEANDAYGWTDKITSFFRPDPDMGTKEQHDKDMINLLYSLKDNPKPEAKGQRLEDLLPNQISEKPSNINEILMRKLYEQINKNKIQDEQDEEVSYPSKGYGALF